MERRIRIRAGAVEIAAEMNNSQTARAIWDTLPVRGYVNLWGDEIYFSVPLNLEPDDAQELVAIGDLGYWPQGPALRIFFGLTPISKGQEIRPASPVNVFGKIVGNTAVLREIPSGTEIVLEKDTQD
ncbi:MAG: cyclophilin-like fold protein [Dehalococcoidia bacterium]